MSDIVELLKSRKSETFEGECHLTNEEADAIITELSTASALEAKDARIAEQDEEISNWEKLHETACENVLKWQAQAISDLSRAKAAETEAARLRGLLEEAGRALEPFADDTHSSKDTHLLEWLPHGYKHCMRGSEEWAQSYLNSAKSYIEAFERAARSLHSRIKEKGE